MRQAESAALRAHAVEHGLLFEPAWFDVLWQEQGRMGGSENDIIYHEATGRVWKRNRIEAMHVSWRQFFDRLLLHAAHFPEAPLRFEGVVDSETGLRAILSQPDVHAVRGAARPEVEPFMRTRGYVRTLREDYSNADLLVEDLHDGNVLVDSSGSLHVIDPVIFVRSCAPSSGTMAVHPR